MPTIKAELDTIRAELRKRRLHPGKGLIGPEYAGCCNTGRRPRLRRNLLGEYIAGPALAVDDVSQAICFGRTGPKMEKLTARHRRLIRNRNCVVTKTAGAARCHFLRLCEDVLTFNAKVRAERKAAAQDMKSSDYARQMLGALRYADTV